MVHNNNKVACPLLSKKGVKMVHNNNKVACPLLFLLLSILKVKSLVLPSLFLLLVILPVTVRADFDITSVTLNGGGAASVNPSEQISLAIVLSYSGNTNGSNGRWGSTKSLFNGIEQCNDHSDNSAPGPDNITFNIFAPNTAGDFNLTLTPYSNDSCGGQSGNNFIVENAIIVRNSNPIADYRFDECLWNGTVGEVKDSSGNNRHGTALSGANTFQNSKIMNGGNFTTISTDAVDIGRPDLGLTNQMTVMAWVNWQILPSTGAAWSNIVSFNSSSSLDKHSFTLQHNSTNNKFEFAVTTGTNTRKYATSTATTQQNTWQHVVGVYDGSKLIVYVNGVPSTATMSQSGTIIQPPADAKLQIGQWAYATAPRNFSGYLDEIKIFNRALSAIEITSIYGNENTGKNYDGSVRMSSCGICQNIKSTYSTTTDGYYFVNEATAAVLGLKPFEIYCQDMNTTSPKPYLPTVINQSNSANSNFKFNAISSSNYYTSTNKTYLSKIRIDENLSAHSDFLTQGFSNINLIGTPFKVDMNNTTLATCDSAGNTSKLRIGHFDQAIKIDPKVETKTHCTASKMPFKQISNYYAKDAYSNLTTCSQIAQNSSSRPPSGYYLLKKVKQTVGEGNYIVAYCEMNPPVEKQIWTFFLALDGQTTDQKSDVVNGNDTCSKVGYSFFTPNQKSVMESTRLFLLNLKSEWSDYAGTVREYFNDYGISGWATNSATSIYKPYPIPDGPMWPYGPFGIYKATGGGPSGDKKIAMSTSFLSSIDTTDGFGSLASIGWKSVLPEISPSYADKWWVADIAAGYARNASGHLVRVNSSIEPNGDYDANNWLGWFADANGYIIHYNDQNVANRYRYSNYMCTSLDMYNTVDKLWDTWGFDAWDTTKSITLRTISTKKVNENFALTIASLNPTNTALSDFNGTICARVVNDKNVSLNGNGSSLYFNNISTQTLSNLNISKAVKDARVLLTWKNNINTTCPLSADANSTLATDNFAIRPNTFTITNPTTAYAGDSFMLDFKALDSVNNSCVDYNESKDGSFAVTSAIVKTSCSNGILNVANFSFINGQKLAVDNNYSDVGDVNISIAEKLGSEFAKVDASDTSDANRLITPATLVVTVNPYELNITDANFTASTGKTWLYDANVSDMYVSAHAAVQANNKQHVALQNFTSSCYAQPVDLSFYYDANNTNANVNLSYAMTSGTMASALKSISDINKTITLPASLFTTSSASADYRFNIDRAYNVPLSPIDISLRDVKVTSLAVAKNENNATVNKAARFYYGRIKTKDIVTDKTIAPHLLHVEVYSPTAISGFYQNTLNWYINADDDGTTVLSDGNFSENKAFLNNQPSSSVGVSGTTSFLDGISRFNINNLLEEKGSVVHVGIPTWLWNSTLSDYNNSVGATCVSHPCFDYKYIKDKDTIGIKSGTFKGSMIGNDYNATYQKSGVKTFR